MRSAPSLPTVKTSPLFICDRLLTLAQEADQAGCSITAEHLFHLAHAVLDEKPSPKLGPN